MRALVRACDSSARVIAVSSATDAATAWGVSEELRLAPEDVPFLIDPERALYAALGLARSVRATFAWHSWRNVFGALAFPRQCCRGRVPTLNAGDPWQQGGVFVVDRSGVLLFAHRDEAPGWPKVDAAAFARALRRLDEAAPPPQAAGQQPRRRPVA